jgi:hypothetical protein
VLENKCTLYIHVRTSYISSECCWRLCLCVLDLHGPHATYHWPCGTQAVGGCEARLAEMFNHRSFLQLQQLKVRGRQGVMET